MPAKYYTSKKTNRTKPRSTSGNRDVQRRAAAFAKPPTGQFAPGALTEKGRTTGGRGDGKTVAPSLDSRFVTLPSGKTGTRVDRTDPKIALSEGVAEKASKAGVSVSASPFGSVVTEGQQLPEPNALLRTPPPTGVDTPQPLISEPVGVGNIPESLPPQVPNAAQNLREFNPGQPIIDLINKVRTFNGVGKLFGDDKSLVNVIQNAPLGVLKGNLGKVSATGTVSKEALKNGGIKGVQKIAELIGKNVRTTKNITSWKPLIAAGGIIWALSGIIKDSTGTGSIGIRDRLEEARGGADILLRDMQDDPVALKETLELIDKIKNAKTSWIPFGIGAAKNAKQYTDFMDTAVRIRLGHLERKNAIESTGTTERENNAAFWLNYHRNLREEETEEQRIRNENFNNSRITTEERIAQIKLELQNEINTARSDLSDREREQRRKQMKEEADFWLQYREQVIAMQKQQQEETAKFWLEYRKMVLKLQEDSGRSSLRFGLFG